MTTIDEIEKLLHVMRAQKAAEAETRLLAAQRQLEAEEAEKAAEDARRYSNWWALEKQQRLRCIVPPGLDISHFQFTGDGRRWSDHRGAMVRGAEMIPVEVENGKRVLYLRSIGDFRLVTRNERDGLQWQLSNPELMRRMLAVMPRNEPSIPAPYQEPAGR